MTTVQNVSSTSSTTPSALTGLASASSSATAASGAANSTDNLSSTFMTLLVTQLQNQDPLNPLDGSQMTTQLAQIGTVNGINQLNSTIQALSASFNASQYLQAATLVGHNVLSAGSQLQLTGGKAQGGANLAQAVDSLTVTISNSSGQVVQTLQLGPQPAGVASFQWDGKTSSGSTAPDGTYTFSAAGTANGTAVTPTALEFGQVTGVVAGTNGTQLQVTGLGLVNVSSLVQID